MKKHFKVTDPKGVHFDGRHIATGETFSTPTPLSAHAQSFVHFKQVEEVAAPAAEEATKDSADEPAPKGKGK